MRTPPPNYGRFDSEQKALQAVVQRLADALQPLSIYLFGSRAEGRARPDSDFDLVVVLDDEAPNSDADYDEVYAPLLDMDIGCDVIPCRWSVFRKILQDPTNPWQTSWSSAKGVYGQPGRELRDGWKMRDDRRGAVLPAGSAGSRRASLLPG